MQLHAWQLKHKLTHTHTHTYIYIYIYKDPYSKSEAMKSLKFGCSEVRNDHLLFAHVRLPALSVTVSFESLQSARQPRNLSLALDVHLTVDGHIK